LKQHIVEQDKEIFSLIALVIDVINTHSLWGSEDEYTFSNGETWYRFDPDWEQSKTHAKTEELNNE
jgi:hypothetical protein